MRPGLVAIVIVVMTVIGACGGGRPFDGDDDDPSVDARGSGGAGGGIDVFASSTTNVVIEIDYESGQQPYTGPMAGFGDTFDPSVTNLQRLFAGKKTVELPTTLAAMENVGTIADEELTIAEIHALAAAHRDELDREGTKTYYVIFVSGYYVDANGPNMSVLGVSSGDKIAMFKDVIRSTGSVTQPHVARYVEQSTLVHELAHSIGLVDNGVPMAAPHKDTAHGAHCDDSDCAMFWLNEGASEAGEFAVRRLITGSTILFDDACLADVDALTGGI
jgi:hypothetical protein